MSFWNPFRIKQNSIVALIDISSAQVSGALISVLTDKKGYQKNQIIFSTKVEISLEKNLDFNIFNFEIIKAVEKVTCNLLKSGFSQPKKFVCFLGSPFVVSQTKIINYSQDTEFVFTEKILNRIIQREIDAFRLKNNQNNQFNIIESKIMQIKLNGYEIPQPFNNKIKQFTVAQFLSGISTNQLDKIKQAIVSQSHNDKIDFHSFTFASFSVLRDILPDQKNFFVIDVNGELTDIFVCLNGVLVENMSFPYGINSILRDITFQQKNFLAETKTQLNLYTEGRLHKSTKNIFEKSLKISQEKWLDYLSNAFALALDSLIIPEHIVLISNTKTNQIFKNWFQAGDFKKYKLADTPFKILYMNYTNLAEIANQPKTIQDTYLVFESLFFDKINK